MAAVTLIANPPFVLDLHNFKIPNEQPKSIQEKVQAAVGPVIELARIAGSAALDALWTNARYAGSTFKYIVLRYDGEHFHAPETHQDWIYRGGLWLVAHTVGFLYCSITNFMKEYQSLPSYLLSFATRGLNLSHLTARKTNIDVSHVPDTLQVANLLTTFDSINFTDKNAPGYMPEVARKETIERYTVTYSVAALRKHLNTFIKNVNERTPITGTPPSFLAAQLMKFYKKIEDAVRYSLDKVTNEYDEFMRARDMRAPLKGEADYQKYQDLLENKARVVIDMAIAGAHCGARYMGDALDTFFGLEDPSRCIEQQTMQGKLFLLLGKKREKVAREHIVTHLGHDTHHFSAYMANMGGILGLPGTEDVVEYLTGSRFDRQKFLRLFFEAYTPDFIRDAVQTEIKSSQVLRESIFNWLKDQVGDWKKAEYQIHAQNIIKAAKTASSETASGYEAKIEQFRALVQELDRKGSWNAKFPESNTPYFADIEKNWDEFFDSIFGCPDAKEYLNELFKSAGTQVEIIRARQQFKTALSKPEFQAGLKEIVRKTGNRQNLKTSAAIYEKIDAINAGLISLGLPTMIEEVLYRNLAKGGKLEDVVHGHIDRLRSNEFLDQLIRTREDEEPATTVTREGLKRPLLDWILYASHIFTIPPNGAGNG